MTNEQLEICKAFAQVTFLPASWDKRFASNLMAMAENYPDRTLTPAQDECTYRLLYKYRRQMPSVYEKYKSHPHCRQKAQHERGAMVRTKSGKTGRILSKEQPVNGKVIVHTADGNLLCDPKQLKLLGYFD